MTKSSRIVLLAMVVVMLFAGVSLAENVVQNLDNKIFHFINSDLKSPILDKPMLYITHSGDSLWHVATIGGLYLGGQKDTATLLSSALLKTAWTTQILKYAIHRPRPVHGIEDIQFVDDYVMDDGKSFPSGHTTEAVALATVLAHQYPQYAAYFYSYAALVGFSRIYVGAHYPSDVLAGAVLGYAIGESTMNNKQLILNGKFLTYSIKF